MRVLQTVLALVISLGTAGVASAACSSKKCPASEAVDAVLAEIAAECNCDPTNKATRKDYSKCAKEKAKAAKQSGALSGACSKAAKSCALKSTCGKPGKVVCCQLKNNGAKLKAFIAKNETKCEQKGSACPAFTLASEGCADDGTCATVTTTSSSTTTSIQSDTTSTSTSTVTTTSTSTTLPASCASPNRIFEFTTGTFGGDCGDILAGNSTKLADIGCGGLDIGGGISIVAEGPVPDGAITRFSVACQPGNPQCDVCPNADAEILPNGVHVECTAIGCSFGPPLPFDSPPGSCVVNTFRQPAAGILNTATGAATITFPLNSQTFLTGDTVTPCPYCTNGTIDPETEQPIPLTGSVADPETGTCAGGATPGAACVTSNSQGLTNDCLPGGATTTPTEGCPDPPCPCDGSGTAEEQNCADGSVNLGGLEVNLTNATTATSTLDGQPDGFFCPNQDHDDGAQRFGCFGAHVEQSTGVSLSGQDCRTISATGVPAGALPFDTVFPITLASTFCIPAVNLEEPTIVDFAANLPGPGAAVLTGSGVLSSPSGAFLTLD
jgi:hypothetical protein